MRLMVVSNGEAGESGNQPYLREWRDAFGWTQEQVGEKIGRDKSTVSELENGNQQLTLRYLQDFARIYGVRVSRLFSLPDKPSLDDEIAELPSPQRDTIIQMIHGLKSTGTDN